MLFARADVDGSNTVDKTELKALFQGMGVAITETELNSIFMSIDFDMSGSVSFPEFISDFNKTVITDTTTLIINEKERYNAESLKAQQYEPNVVRNDLIVAGVGKVNTEIQYQTKIAILETREKQMNKKLETAMSILNHAT